MLTYADACSRERMALLAAFSEVDFHPLDRDRTPPTWTAAAADAPARGGGGGAEGAGGGGREVAAARARVHNVDQLWVVLYHQLRLLAVDARIEVLSLHVYALLTASVTSSASSQLMRA
jgi:hypothetical protein